MPPINETYEGDVDVVAEETEKAAQAADTTPDEDLSKEIEGDKEEAQDDLTGEQFVYTADDGTEYQGTINEIISQMVSQASAGQTELQKQLAELQLKMEEKPAAGEEKVRTESTEGDIPAVDWSKSGEILAKSMGIDPADMSEVEKQTLDRVGFALQDGIVREVLTNPYIAGQFKDYAKAVLQEMLEERETTTKRTTAFEQFVGEKFDDAAIAAFQKDNPWASTKEMAVLGLKAQSQAQTVQAKEGETEKAKKKAASEATKKLIETKKAAGTLKLLGSKGGARAGARSGKQTLRGDDRIDAAVDALRQMRSGG